MTIEELCALRLPNVMWLMQTPTGFPIDIALIENRDALIALLRVLGRLA